MPSSSAYVSQALGTVVW